MNTVVWRIVQQRFANAAFTGEGARRFGGRWNSIGQRVIYCAQSQSLAALEMLVHTDSEWLLQNYLVVQVTIPTKLIQRLPKSALPKDWREYPAPPSTHAIGDKWVMHGATVVLEVPSVVIPSESNFLINPLHREFRKLRIGKAIPFQFDLRLSP
jgi:RES domain-containing protein